MSKKRKGNFDENSSNSNKRRKLTHKYSKYAKSKLFENPYDQIQYKQIFKSINSSSLIQNNHVSEGLIKEIAEYSNGQWVKCFNPRCRSNISFLAKDVEELLPLKCIVCNRKAYYQWCAIHNQPFTVPTMSEPMCDECFAIVCYNGMKKCRNCESWICENCELSNGGCIGCVTIT